MAKFELDPDELERFKKWNEQHLADRHNGREPYSGASGGRISFTVCNTSLGQIVSVKCGACDAKECLTNFDDW